jgi:regulator of RNase E activity RraA
MNDSIRILETLRKYDSATIANVVELFDIRPNTAGYMKGAVRAIYPEMDPIIGFASTATFRSAYPTGANNAYQRLPAQLRAMQGIPGPKIAVIQDLDQPAAAATFGEVMCTAYQRFGCVGIISSGAARDIAQVRALKFPAFASSVIVSHGYSRLEDVDVPVQIDGLTVRPGDLLHADANGVVLIPAEIAEEVAGVCQDFVSVEQMVLDYLHAQEATIDGYQQCMETAIQRFGVISKKLRPGE